MILNKEYWIFAQWSHLCHDLMQPELSSVQLLSRIRPQSAFTQCARSFKSCSSSSLTEKVTSCYCLTIWILQEKVKPALIIASVIGRPLVTTSIFGKTPPRVGTMQRPFVPAAMATSPPSLISKSKTS